MLRFVLPIALLLIAWLLLREAVVTSTAPGRDTQSTSETGLSARLDHAGDLAVGSPGAAGDPETAGERDLGSVASRED